MIVQLEEQDIQFSTTSLVFETLFAVDIISKFLLIRQKPLSHELETDIIELAKLYLRSTFLLDLVPLLPLAQIFNFLKHSRLFLLVKLLRLATGFELLNYQVVMRELKHY